jgi:hypothetical protein
MIMGPDTNKKSVAALIVSRMKPNGKAEDVTPEAEGGLSEGEQASGEEMMAAMEAKDVVGFVSALKDLIEVMSPAEPEAPKSGFTE